MPPTDHLRIPGNGCYSGVPFVSGIGARSTQIAYGMNRANFGPWERASRAVADNRSCIVCIRAVHGAPRSYTAGRCCLRPSQVERKSSPGRVKLYPV